MWLHIESGKFCPPAGGDFFTPLLSAGAAFTAGGLSENVFIDFVWIANH